MPGVVGAPLGERPRAALVIQKTCVQDGFIGDANDTNLGFRNEEQGAIETCCRTETLMRNSNRQEAVNAQPSQSAMVQVRCGFGLQFRQRRVWKLDYSFKV